MSELIQISLDELKQFINDQPDAHLVNLMNGAHPDYDIRMGVEPRPHCILAHYGIVHNIPFKSVLFRRIGDTHILSEEASAWLIALIENRDAFPTKSNPFIDLTYGMLKTIIKLHDQTYEPLPSS